jgi:Zn-dependent M28 family amino/carboxypeptidase
LLVLAAFVGATLMACTGAKATEASVTRTPAPASVSTVAPTDASSVAPASVSAVAPTGASSIAPAFDGARAWTHLQKQMALGPRPAGSAALNDLRKYILDQLKADGIDARQQVFMASTPLGEMMMSNIVATIPGRRTDRIILASHYDTKRAPNFRFVGASDGASSTAALLELGRVLKARQNEFTIELLFLDGEEAVNWEWQDPDNTYGSRHYVDAARKANTAGSIRAMILLDMIGDKNLLIKRDSYSTPWLVDAIWGAAARLGHGEFSSQLSTVEDDHLAFLRAGIPSVDIIDLDNYAPYWHTAQDDLAHVSAKSLQIVGDVVLAALPDIEARLAAQK